MEVLKKEEFIAESKNFFNTYKKKIGEAIRESERVIFVSFNDLVSFSPELSEAILEKPEEMLSSLELALDEIGLVKNPRIRFLDLPPNSFIKVRNIRSKHLNKFIWIEGIVRQASDVRPQVVSAKFECPSCGTLISVLQLDKKFKEPSRCSCGRKGFFKLVSKQMVDAQRLVIEESPESLSGGEQPRRVNVFLKEDLVEPRMEERTTPGSKIRVFGILNEVPVPLPTGNVSTRFDLAIDANNVIPLEETYEDLKISEEDELQIKELSLDPHVFKKLAENIAPSIYGYEEVKQALVLQLFGGVRKEKLDRTVFRGDIHVLLVGDPGVAKSVTLKFVSMIAPRGRYVVGKSASGAGLTATVVRDEFLRGWSLEAGAMVLSNKGIVCIDEIEKMDPNDRSAMHEAMEQQTVTISKANVQASLRAETSVLAAGNPKFGRFDPYQTIASQIDIQPTLLNRFDVIFILRDNPDKAKDDAIASHVLFEHKDTKARGSIDVELFRKYVAYAKKIIQPKLSDEAIEEIKKFYVTLRNAPTAADLPLRPIPITARQLEALVRLSEASAKTRLSEKVEKQDATRAINLMKYYLMQAGYDYETKSFDIDKIVTGVTASKRGKILEVKESIIRLESKIGKLIPVEEIEKELEGKMQKTDLDDVLDKLALSGDIFHPKKGYIQRV
ncbi:minichromosome maintenance protein MCM, partial [Candidatus Pacearchaeota archaeon]|nr:minichromosome maintenance protein MCM [Candidatus Pacearchaeota archaeon]